MFHPYRGCAAASVEGDLFPSSNKNGHSVERWQVLEILPDIFGDLLEEIRIRALPVIDFPSDAVVDVCPERSDKSPPVSQGERLWRELADQHIKGNDAIVVDLRGKAEWFDLSQ